MFPPRASTARVSLRSAHNGHGAIVRSWAACGDDADFGSRVFGRSGVPDEVDETLAEVYQAATEAIDAVAVEPEEESEHSKD